MKVFVTQPIHEDGISLLERQGYKVDVSSCALSKTDLMERIRDVDALVCSYDTIDREIINAGENLKVISSVSVGLDKVDVSFAKECGIIVTNVPGTLDQTMAEFVFAHLLSSARNIISSDRYVREQKEIKWQHDSFLGDEISGKTLGIIGFGRIGRALVPIARGFGMNVLYTNKNARCGYKEHCVQYETFTNVLINSDFIVLLVPLIDETVHLITYRELALMNKQAVLLNMSRGKVVCEKDLIRALKKGLIKGACLDVYEFEPKISEELLGMENTILTPHLGSATKEARRRMAKKAAENVIRVLG